MAVEEGAYNRLPAPPVVYTGAVVTYDGAGVTAGGAYAYNNATVTMSTYQNTFPNYIVGWPAGNDSNSTDQNTISGVYKSFIGG